MTEVELSLLVADIIDAYDNGANLANETETDTTWDLMSSIFFCTTIVTTIGESQLSSQLLVSHFFVTVL